MAEKYDEGAEACVERANMRINASTEEALRKTASRYSTLNTEKSDIVLNHGEIKYALLPVWMLSSKWEGQNFLFAMNGQTGKLVGDLPMAWSRFWAWFVGLTLPMILLMELARMKFDFQPAMSVVVPLIIAGITCFVWKSAMKSAIVARDANKYIPMDGFELTGEEDRFLREEVTRRKIEKK